MRCLATWLILNAILISQFPGCLLHTGSVSHQPYICPHGVPLWLNRRNTSNQVMLEPICSDTWYPHTECQTCNSAVGEKYWISGTECPTYDYDKLSIHVKKLQLSHCSWTDISSVSSVNRTSRVIRHLNWKSSPPTVKICLASQLAMASDSVVKFAKLLRDEDEEKEAEHPAILQPTPEPESDRTANLTSRLKFHCASGRQSPARVNGTNLRRNNGLFCGNVYPCTKQCYEATSCTLNDKRDDFISGYDCATDENEDQPYACQFTCCTSGLVKLHNCTWHYPTDRYLVKGNFSELVLRRVDHFPYILEVCAVRKLNTTEFLNDTSCGSWHQYKDVQKDVESQLKQINQINRASQAVRNQGGQTVSDGTNQQAAAAGDLSELELAGQAGGAEIARGAASAAASAAAAVKAALIAAGCSPLDMVFVVDSSHSLLATGFANERSLITGIMAFFDYSTIAGLKQSRVGLIEFGNSAVQSFDLATYALSPTANSQVLLAVNSLTYLDSVGTDMVGGINMAATMYSAVAAKPDVRRVTILITDGQPNVPSGLTTTQYQSLFATAAANLQSVTGEEIYAVAATAEGQILTTNFGISSSHTSYTDVSSGLPGLAATVVKQICSPTVTTSTTTTTTAPTTTSTTTSTTTTTTTLLCVPLSTASVTYSPPCGTGCPIGTTATITCPTGGVMSSGTTCGVANSVCQASGTWSYATLDCGCTLSAGTYNSYSGSTCTSNSATTAANGDSISLTCTGSSSTSPTVCTSATTLTCTNGVLSPTVSCAAITGCSVLIDETAIPATNYYSAVYSQSRCTGVVLSGTTLTVTCTSGYWFSDATTSPKVSTCSGTTWSIPSISACSIVPSGFLAPCSASAPCISATNYPFIFYRVCVTGRCDCALAFDNGILYGTCCDGSPPDGSGNCVPTRTYGVCRTYVTGSCMGTCVADPRSTTIYNSDPGLGDGICT